jgi:hypothetical protein
MPLLHQSEPSRALVNKQQEGLDSAWRGKAGDQHACVWSFVARGMGLHADAWLEVMMMMMSVHMRIFYASERHLA